MGTSFVGSEIPKGIESVGDCIGGMFSSEEVEKEKPVSALGRCVVLAAVVCTMLEVAWLKWLL